MERAELALIPGLGAGHLTPMVELGKSLTSRDDRVSVTILIMEDPFQSKLNSYTQSLLSNQPPPRVRFVHLALEEPSSDRLNSMSGPDQMTELLNINMPRVKNFYTSEEPAAFVVDMFCTHFADVAEEFGAPCYAFATSNAYFLGFLFYLQSAYDDENKDLSEFKGSETELSIPDFVHPVPAKILPSIMLTKENGGFAFFLDSSRNLRNVKGILVNTYMKLESYAIKCMSEDKRVPPIHTVGPMLNSNNDENDIVFYDTIKKWLDNQPSTSVVFLCFGSKGAFEITPFVRVFGIRGVTEQVVEIALALEKSGHRFLWALRRPPPKSKLHSFVELSSEYDNLNDVLPEGFLDRTKEIGKVIGWAPQVAVLSHPSVGGFVSHCGWNSTLESLSSGVPMAMWPLYAEQRLNAFEMVKELGLAIEIKLVYHLLDNPTILTAEEIAKGIRLLMEKSGNAEIWKKVKAMKEECQRTMVDVGSSYGALGHVIHEILNKSL